MTYYQSVFPLTLTLPEIDEIILKKLACICFTFNKTESYICKTYICSFSFNIQSIMTTRLFSCLTLIFTVFFFSACKKVEGTGGSSSIRGKISALNYNSAGIYQNNSYDAADVDVYIIYGDNKTIQDDKVATSYDGSFEFNYLEKGNYTLYVYEKCFGTDCPTGKTVVLKSATISKSKETVDVGTIEIKD